MLFNNIQTMKIFNALLKDNIILFLLIRFMIKIMSLKILKKNLNNSIVKCQIFSFF